MRFQTIGAIVFTIAIGLSISLAEAGECGRDYCWGALAAGPNGATGRATSMRTAPDAMARALQICGKGCETGEVFVNSCAAIAQDAARKQSFGWDIARATAERRAMAACEAEGKSCRIRVWACSR